MISGQPLYGTQRETVLAACPDLDPADKIGAVRQLLRRRQRSGHDSLNARPLDLAVHHLSTRPCRKDCFVGFQRAIAYQQP